MNWVALDSDKDRDKESSALQHINIISDSKDSNSSTTGNNILNVGDEHASNNSNTDISLDRKKRPATDLSTTTATTTTTITEEQQEKRPLKKQKLLGNVTSTGHNSDPSSYCLDMSDGVYFRDRAPLMDGCKCLACRYIYRCYHIHIIHVHIHIIAMLYTSTSYVTLYICYRYIQFISCIVLNIQTLTLFIPYYYTLFICTGTTPGRIYTTWSRPTRSWATCLYINITSTNTVSYLTRIEMLRNSE